MITTQLNYIIKKKN